MQQEKHEAERDARWLRRRVEHALDKLLPNQDFTFDHDGLSRLARAIDHFAEEGPDAQLDAFIEQAGILLASVFLAHLDCSPVRDGQRLALRVGAHGWFDPFAAIAHALEEPRAKPALVKSVGEAEAEARGSGAYARIHQALCGILEQRHLQVRVERHFSGCFHLTDGVVVDLCRALEAAYDNDFRLVHTIIERHVEMAYPGPAFDSLASWSSVSSRVLPRLVSQDFVVQLAAANKASLYTARRLGPISVTLQVPFQKRCRFITEPEVEGWGQSNETLLQHALANLRSLSERVRLCAIAGTSLWTLRCGDGFDSARLLLPNLVAHLRSQFGDEPLAAVPHRDTLIVCKRTRACTQELRKHAEAERQRAPHPVSDQIFTWKSGAEVDGVGPALVPMRLS